MDGKTLMIPTNGEQANLTAISVVEMIWYVFLPTTLTNVGVVGVLCVVMVDGVVVGCREKRSFSWPVHLPLKKMMMTWWCAFFFSLSPLSFSFRAAPRLLATTYVVP